MYISRLFIKNFRNFRHLDLQLIGGVTCFIGENNVGKTNLFQALRVLLDGSLGAYRRRLQREDFSEGLVITTPEHVLISVEFSDFQGNDAQEAMLFGAQLAVGNKARLSYRFRPNTKARTQIANAAPGAQPQTLTIDDYSWQIVGGGDDVNDLNAVAWDRDFGNPIKLEDLWQGFLVSFMEALRNVEEKLAVARTSPLQQIIEQRNIPQAERGALVGHLQTANDSINASVTIADLGTNLTTAFQDAAGSSYAMGVRLGLGEASFGDVSRALRVLLSGYGMQNLSPGRNGLGLNNVLFVSMLLASFERRLADGKLAGQLLLVEEPEAHLHPQLQRVLLATLRRKNVQIFITTHSTHITSGVPLSSHVVLTSGGTAVSSAVAPTQIAALAREDVADLERYLDATRSNLLYARRVMLVEGPAELFVIPRLIKKVAGIDLDEAGVAVVPIFGTHFAAYARLFGAGGIQKRCAIVTDGDEAPAIAPAPAVPAANPDNAVAQVGVAAADDAGGADEVDDLTAFVRQDLNAVRGANVEVFTSRTTFEREITLFGNLEMIEDTLREVGSSRRANAVRALRALDPAAPDRDARLAAVQTQVLNAAEELGKGRFGQVLSKHAEKATALPDYIQRALAWLRQ